MCRRCGGLEAFEGAKKQSRNPIKTNCGHERAVSHQERRQITSRRRCGGFQENSVAPGFDSFSKAVRVKCGGAAEGWKPLRVPKSSFGTRQKETAEGWKPWKVPRSSFGTLPKKRTAGSQLLNTFKRFKPLKPSAAPPYGTFID